MNANGCAYVAATLDGNTTKIRAMGSAVERAKLDGLVGRLSADDAKALDAAMKAREEMLAAARKMQAAYEDLTYRMRVCSRR